MTYRDRYIPVTLESQRPDGTWSTINRFVNENSAVQSGDPAWPRQRLLDLAAKTMTQWDISYPGKRLRISNNGR
jgi:hypothetical protein